MVPFIFLSIVVLNVVFGILLGRLYTGFALPSLQEDMSFLPSRRIDQMKRYIDNEERAGRRRWYHGLIRSAPLVQVGLFALLLATALLSVWRDP